MKIPGVGGMAVMALLSEAGYNFTDNWKTAKNFTSWLGTCPNNKITGRKVKSSKTLKNNNRLSTTLRMAAQTVRKSDNIIGEFYRRMRGRLGPNKAVTATAHKLARIIYSLVTKQEEYDPVKTKSVPITISVPKPKPGASKHKTGFFVSQIV